MLERGTCMPDTVEMSNAATVDTALVIMARYPQAGAIKTRLARAIGEDATVELYRAFLTDLALKFARNQPDQHALHWCYTPKEDDFATLMAMLTPTLMAMMRFFP